MTSAPSSESPQYSDRYAAISQRLLRQAQAELDAGDLIQASEKAWGAAAHAIKAVAEKWGWFHQGHYRLDASVHYIVSERGREDLLGLYSTVNVLHFNYYEHELGADLVQSSLNATKTFVGEMEKIRAESRPTFPPLQNLTVPQARRLRLLFTQPRDYKGRLDDISLLPPVDPDGQDSL